MTRSAAERGERTGTILSGVDTLTRLLLLRAQLDERDGLRTATMVSGYPGSPLGTFDLALDRLGPELDRRRIVHRRGLNEELAASTVWGSQMGAAVPYAGVDGVAGAWYGKAPGLDRSGDTLKHGNAMGSGPNGGVVLFCGDDPLAKSSTLTCDSQHALEDACIPVLAPGDQQEVLDLGIHAFRLSRFAGPWVGLKIVTAVADGIGTVDLDPDRHTVLTPDDVEIAGRPWHHEPQTTVGPHAVPDQEVLVVDHRLRAAQAYVRHNGLDVTMGAGPAARLGIVVAGKTHFDLVQALADLGLGVDDLGPAGIRILKLAMTYPVVPETVTGFAASVDEVLVIEEKRPFVEGQIRSLLHETGSTVPVRGKRDGDGEVLLPIVGELDADLIRAALLRCAPDLAPRAEPAVGPKLLPLVDVPGRAPGYCSGCPHNRSTVAPEGALVGGGVGCHGIMYFEARNAGMKRLPPTPMGSEGVPWLGLSPFVDEPHLIQNLGDGTLSHSGTLAIRAAVAAGADMTFKILYNDAVAMTGGQDVVGLPDVPSLTRALEAEGVRRIVVCAQEPQRYGSGARWAPGVEVLGRAALPDVQERLRDERGVTVVVYDQICAAEARRLRKLGELEEPPERVVINEAVCEGCGDCATKSNCLSVLPVETEFGVKREIHEPSCNRDYTCLEGDCPSFVTITPVSPQVGAARIPEPAVPLPDGELPDPVLPALDGQYGLYFTGIGGTGVVTANRVLASAAGGMGLVVEGMDQTGLSQKAGAVVSHLHFAPDRAHLGAAAIGTGGADAYLSGDLLQAAGAPHLDRVARGRTLAVVDSSFTPTAAMLQGAIPTPDLDGLRAAVTDRVGAARTHFVDSKGIAEGVFADHLLANIVLLGAAFQVGALPMPLADLDAAFERQGRFGESNRQAFAWGRWAGHDPVAVERSLRTARSSGGRGALKGLFDPSAGAEREAAGIVAAESIPAALRDLVLRRTAQVVDYQDARRSRRFVSLVADACAVDDPSCDWEFTRAVVAGWHQVLTYKDEYEVARLHRRADYRAAARELGITGEVRVQYQLHPPVLRRFGVDRKVPMGKGYDAAFAVLERMKRLRGTRADPFGWHPDRVTERAVIDQYEQLVRSVCLDPTVDYATRVEAAASILEVRGYGPIKEAAVEAWRSTVASLRAKMTDAGITQQRREGPVT